MGTPTQGPETLVKWRNDCPLVVEEIQKLLTDGTSIDVRVRCRDHQPSDGLGAHKLVLAAASPDFLKVILPDASIDDDLVCVHLPDFSSFEVGPVMSLLYFGEIWMTETCAAVYQKVLDSLRICVRLSWNSSSNSYALEPRHNDASRHAPSSTRPFSDIVHNVASHCDSNRITQTTGHSKDDLSVPLTVRVKCEDVTSLQGPLEHVQKQEHSQQQNELPSNSGYLVPKRCLSMSSGGGICKIEAVSAEERDEVPMQIDPAPHLLDLKLIKREAIDEEMEEEVDVGSLVDSVNLDDVSNMEPVNTCDVIVTNVSHCSEPGCSFSTSSLSSIQTHRLVHHRKKLVKELKLSCPVCGVLELNSKELKEHVVQTHGELVDRDLIQCRAIENCTFSDFPDSFFEHISTSHSSNVRLNGRLLFCDYPKCYFVSEKSSNLSQHLRTHNDERAFACTSCGLKFRTSSHVKAHYRSRHSTTSKIFTCAICPKSFATPWQLKSHSKAHENFEEARKPLDNVKSQQVISDVKRFKCRRCDAKYDKLQSLAGHVRSAHPKLSADKDLKASKICETCGLAFSTSNMLRKHKCSKRKRGPAEVESPTDVCPICRKEVARSGLKNHLHYHKKKKEEGEHTCQVCNKSFTTFHSLQRHSLIHEDKKPFKCQVCDKAFRQKGSLESHNRVHTGVRVSCRGCGQKFITNSLLNQHLQIKLECQIVDMT